MSYEEASKLWELIFTKDLDNINQAVMLNEVLNIIPLQDIQDALYPQFLYSQTQQQFINFEELEDLLLKVFDYVELDPEDYNSISTLYKDKSFPLTLITNPPSLLTPEPEHIPHPDTVSGQREWKHLKDKAYKYTDKLNTNIPQLKGMTAEDFVTETHKQYVKLNTKLEALLNKLAEDPNLWQTTTGIVYR
jgi:hypothetical protein